MDRRPLGRSEIVIEPLVLGGNVFGWTVDEKTGFAILDAFVEEGFSAIDTAEGYPNWVPGNPPGMSETIIGKWMKARGNRNAVHILTKVNSANKPGGLGAEKVAAGFDASLKRLQTDYVDVYFSHWPDPETGHEETLGAYDPMVRAGKVRVLGASNYTADMVKAAQETSVIKSLPRYEVLQPRFNLYDRTRWGRWSITVSPRASSPANTGPRPISASRHVVVASSAISTRKAQAFLQHWTRLLPPMTPPRPRSPSPGWSPNPASPPPSPRQPRWNRSRASPRASGSSSAKMICRC
jgi:hypothetical protein